MTKFKVGDLVKFRGWESSDSEPLALIVEVSNSDSDFHARVRVMWVGEEIPIQAKVISTTGARYSSWCSPKYFELVGSKEKDPDKIWEIWGDQ